MDYSATSPPGQPNLSALIAMLCDILQVLRAWYEHFYDAMRELDRAAAVKAHDLIVDGVILARKVARMIGHELVNTDGIDWTVAPPQDRPALDM